jgi:hypothetical protein
LAEDTAEAKAAHLLLHLEDQAVVEQVARAYYLEPVEQLDKVQPEAMAVPPEPMARVVVVVEQQ